MAGTQDEVTTVDTEKAKRELLALRERLEHDRDVKARQVAEDGDELDFERGGANNHMADDANQTSEQENMLGLQQSIQRQLDQVNFALSRIENGTYTVCANCGKPINPARLEARPSSTLCIDCQQLQDNGKL